MGQLVGLSFTVTPASQNTTPGVATANYTITLVDGVAGAGGQAFTLSDGGAGGTFTPSGATIASGATTVTFTYTNAAAGTYTLSVAPNGGALSGRPAQTVEAVVVTGSPTPTGFNVAPASQGGVVGAKTGNYYINLTAAGGGPGVAGVGGQAFALTSSEGTFYQGGVAVTSVTIAQGSSSAAFQYSANTTGVKLLTVTASGAPYGTNVQTAQAVIGGLSVSQTLSNPQQTFAVGIMQVNGIPFGQMQTVNLKSAAAFKKAHDATSLPATGVGQDDEITSGDCESLLIDRNKLLQLLGGVQVAVAAIADATTAPTLTAGAGATPFTTGFVAVGYSYVNAYGQTKMSALQSVSLTNAQQITTTSLGALPAGVTSVNWFMSNQVYATSAAALAGNVYWFANNGGGATVITAFPIASSAQPPSASGLGVAMTSWQHRTTDDRPAFDLLLLSSVDATAVGFKKAVVYNCWAPELDWTFALRDFAKEKFTFEAIGRNGVVMEWLTA